MERLASLVEFEVIFEEFYVDQLITVHSLWPSTETDMIGISVLF